MKIISNKIQYISAYKIDLGFEDEVRFDIVYKDGESFTISEENLEFTEIIKSLEQIPDFDVHWRDKVIKPAFAENLTVVFGSC
jgi:hypothetical protein